MPYVFCFNSICLKIIIQTEYFSKKMAVQKENFLKKAQRTKLRQISSKFSSCIYKMFGPSRPDISKINLSSKTYGF